MKLKRILRSGIAIIGAASMVVSSNVAAFANETVSAERNNAIMDEVKSDAITLDIASHVDLSAGEPTKEKDLVSNPDYKEIPYTAPTKTSTAWTPVTFGDTTFYGSVFGNVGSSTVPNPYFELKNNGNNTATIAAKDKSGSAVGKIAKDDEGLGMYYVQIPADAEYTLTAKATLDTDPAANNQGGFGLMARDTMYIDLNEKSHAEDLVFSGVMGTTEGCGFRKDGAMVFSKLPEGTTAAKGNTYDLKIVKRADGYVCFLDGKEAVFSQQSDFQLKSVDDKYQYVGFFATRGVTATFSEVKLEITGGASATSVKEITNTEDVRIAEDAEPSVTNIETVSSKDAEAEHTVYLVGDSTVCSFNDAYYYPRYGYGTQIANYLDGTYKVVNLALSGRSSLTYMADPQYKALFEGGATTENNAAISHDVEGIKAGDVLIIGFGHNDEKEEVGKYTDPKGDYKTEGSFAYSIYENYVKKANDKGAKAIVCTPICRRSSGEITGDKEHITANGDYPAALRKMCADTNTAIIDLTAITKALYNEIGAKETLYMHSWSKNTEGSVDSTHLNIYGAKKVAYLFAKALKDNYAGSSVDPTPGPVDPTPGPSDPVVSPSDAEVSKNAEFAAKNFGNKNSDEELPVAKADNDTISTITKLKKGKVSTVSIEKEKTEGTLTIAAGTKLTLPEVVPTDKNQTYVVTILDGAEKQVQAANGAKLKFTENNVYKSAVKIAKGVVTTKALKDVKKYTVQISYAVGGKNYNYVVNVLNLGFDKKDKKTLNATVSGDSVVIDLKGAAKLTDAENTFKGTIWTVNSDKGKDGKTVVLEPNKPVLVGTSKKGYVAKAILSGDGKSVKLVATNENMNGKLVKGAITLQATANNAKTVKTTIKVVNK